MAEAGIPATPRALLALALPLAASSALGFFMHFVNRTVLSWHSPEALAAALPAGVLAWTVQGAFFVAAGFVGVFVAQHTAAGERREAGAMLWPALALAGIAALVGLALIPARHALAGLFGAEPAVHAGIAELLGWLLAETGPMTAASAIAGFCGGLGRTRRVFAMSLFGALLCVALNRWLVLGGLGVPALGVTGAGIATLSTAVIVLLLWLSWVFSPAVATAYATWQQRNLDRARLRRFFAFALPRGATEVLEMLAFVAFTAVLTRLGTLPLAASNLAFNSYLMAMIPVIGFSQGVSIAVGRALGAERVDLARQAVRSALWLLAPYAALLSAAFALLPQLVLAPARHDDAALWQAQLTLAGPVMQLLAIALPCEMAHWVWRAAVHGAGDTRVPLLLLVGAAVVFLALPAWLTMPWCEDGAQGLVACYAWFALYALAIGWAMRLRYRLGPWASMRVRG
ncbi:MAG: MATE family efflux transporter [Planctomycetota bacterium]|nr:MATE family efflux transporter [Planctomycetota bacterium]